MTRASTWSNPDGLVVGYGRNTAHVTGAGNKDYGHAIKNASVVFKYSDTGVNIPIPAGSHVVGVKLVVGTAWVGGTKVEVGDGSDADGFVSATDGATANLTAGAVIGGTGLYTKGGTDTTAQEFKLYASADTLDVTITGTYTAGDATLLVSYF